MTPELRDYLSAPSLRPLWAMLRSRLERNGQSIRGVLEVQLDDDGADRLSGLLGRPVSHGTARIRLTDLDASLRDGAAARGLVPVVADLTGAPLANLPADRAAVRAGRQLAWTELDRALAEYGLSEHGLGEDGLGEHGPGGESRRGQDWVRQWTDWLRASGSVTRLPAAKAAVVLPVAVQVLARVLAAHWSPASLAADQAPVGLAELASEVTGDAHGLDSGSPAAALILRGISCALGVPPAASAAERRDLWQRVGVSTDEVSGTVITWALRPPGADRWSAMMRERADLGLITHLTMHELHRSAALTRPGEVIHACENPQVLQGLAAAGVDRPLACVSGSPAAAGSALLARNTVRYHGDFDWPGIAIAGRVFSLGARPWRFGQADYQAGLDRLPPGSRLGLTGRAQPTPWDEDLAIAMTTAGVAVHEEAVIDPLLADLR